MPKPLTSKELAEFIELQLGGTVVDIELEADIEKFLKLALLRCKPYMNTTKLMTVPMSRVIDLSGKGIYCVVHVFRGDASSIATLVNSSSGSSDVDDTIHYTSAEDSSVTFTSTLSDDGYLFNPFLVNYYGLLDGTQSVDSIAITILTRQVLNTISGGGSSDIDFYQDGDKLYVDIGGGSSEITLQYLPDYQSVDEVTEPFWINYILNIAVAETKIALGRARSKYKVSNLPYELDGDTLLSEGTSELENLISKLESNQDTWYILD